MLDGSNMIHTKAEIIKCTASVHEGVVMDTVSNLAGVRIAAVQIVSAALNVEANRIDQHFREIFGGPFGLVIVAFLEVFSLSVLAAPFLLGMA